MNSKQGTSITASLEPETFKPNLNEPSDLLEDEQIEKVSAQWCGSEINLPNAPGFTVFHRSTGPKIGGPPHCSPVIDSRPEDDLRHVNRRIYSHLSCYGQAHWNDLKSGGGGS